MGRADACLCDFGLAKHISSVNSVDREPAFVGTIACISPSNRGFGDRRRGRRLLARRMPLRVPEADVIERETEIATVYAHMNEPPPRPSDVQPGLPKGFDAVIAKGTRESADDRYASCGDLAAASDAALRGELPCHGRASRSSARARCLRSGDHPGGGCDGRHRPARRRWKPGTGQAGDRAKDDGLHRRRDRQERRADTPLAGQPWDVAFDTRQAWVMLGDERAASHASIRPLTRCSRRRSSPSRRAASRRAAARLG